MMFDESQQNPCNRNEVNDSPIGSASSEAPSLRKKQNRKKVSNDKTIFNSKPLLSKQAKNATTEQLRSAYEELGLIVVAREEEDKKARQLQAEQVAKARELLAQAEQLNIPVNILQQVIQSN